MTAQSQTLSGPVTRQRREPAPAVKQQQVIGGKAVEVFDQKLAFAALVDTVQGGGEHQVGTRQKQAKQDLVGEGSAFDMASAQSESHDRAIGGDHWVCAPLSFRMTLTKTCSTREAKIHKQVAVLRESIKTLPRLDSGEGYDPTIPAARTWTCLDKLPYPLSKLRRIVSRHKLRKKKQFVIRAQHRDYHFTLLAARELRAILLWGDLTNKDRS